MFKHLRDFFLFSSPRKVSLQRECGNSQRAVVLINATGPGSAIEVNSGMGLTNSYTCIVQFVSTSNNSKMAFSVHKLDLPHSCQSYVKVWGGNENMNQSVQFCEEINDPRGSKAKVFDHNSLYVKIRTDRADWKYGEHRVGFVMTVTALRPSVLVGDNQKRCLRDEYACRGEEHCIHHKFVCDGFNNCGDGSDEKCLSSVIALASIIVGAILITVLIGVFTYYVRRRRRNRPYDTSRATSTQSVQSDTSLFGTVRETYYRPLYPIGEGRKIKLDELAKDPDEPLLPPHYFVKTRPTHEHLPTHLLLTACGSSSQNGLNKERIKKDASVGASTNDEGAEPKTKRSSLTVLSVSFTPGSSRLGVRRKGGGSRRGSFPPTAKGHQEEALVNAVDVKDLKKLTRRTKAANEQADEAEIENEDESHIVDTVDNQEEFQSNRKHMVLLPQ
ncbi:uncharacterized protein LOC111253339 isoform X2 [Varroa destructor]|uniref:CUB domain-containing protein n=1 Tax=Varroa destructor TaxID=109461 RepID=A0A7M7KN06_VARDE|nr:uncharacterized protein LOC111253339 isoform X2 [Varroa destructor]